MLGISDGMGRNMFLSLYHFPTWLKTVYEFQLTVYRMSAVCPCSNSLEYTPIAMRLICLIDVYKCLFVNENEVCKIYSTFTEAFKRVPLHYRPCGKDCLQCTLIM